MTKMRMFKQSGNGIERSVYLIQCCKCGCTDSVAPGNHKGALPPEMLNKKFAQKGWSVGRDEDHDECPGCQLRKQPDRSLVLKFPGSDRSIPIGIVSVPSEPRRPKAMPEAIKAEAPKQMGRDERRLIFEKLNEVYVDERTGYSAKWSDETVAKDMGVPRAWVSEVRDQNFGPDRNEELKAAVLVECQNATVKIEKILDEVAILQKQAVAVANVALQSIIDFRDKG